MSIDRVKLFLLCLLFGILLAGYPCAAAGGEMSAAEVWELLPKGIDVEDDDEIANYVKLVEQGEAIYGALLDIVRANNDPLIAGRALSVLRASKSDNRNARRDAVAELGRILYEKRDISDEWESWTLSLMAEAIADMGEAGDSELLAPLLNHPSGDVRSAVCSGMEKLTAIAVSQDSPVGGEPFAQDNGNVATGREPVPQAKKTYQDYPEWESFPKGMDSEDENQIMAHRRLVEQGESAYEALLAIVRECDDPYIVSSALAILRSSQGDKSGVVVQLKEYFVSRLQGETRADEIVIVDTASALADMGQEDDLESLIPMLSHSSSQVRGVGIMLLGERGGQKTLRALETAKESAPGLLARKGIEEVISAIESRLAAQDSAAAPSP